MKINIHWVDPDPTNRLAEINVFDSNDLKVYVGLFPGSQCRSFAQHLRDVANELETAMAEQITLEKALKLVTFDQTPGGDWYVQEVNDIVNVRGNVRNNVYGNVYGDVRGGVYRNIEGNVGGNVGGGIEKHVHGDIGGSVGGIVHGSVHGNVKGLINGRRWEFIKTPKEKFQRLLEETGNQSLIDAFNDLEDSNG